MDNILHSKYEHQDTLIMSIIFQFLTHVRCHATQFSKQAVYTGHYFAAWCGAALPCGAVVAWPFTQGTVCERQWYGCQRSKGAFTQGTVSPAGGLSSKMRAAAPKLLPVSVKMPVEINWIQLMALRGSTAPCHVITIIATLRWASCGPGTGLQAHPLKSQYRFASSQEISIYDRTLPWITRKLCIW